MIDSLKKALKPRAQADIIDGKLILTLPNALTPAVWQMNLTDTKASALEVIDQDDTHCLTLKTPKGDKVDIASFVCKQDAIKALMATSKALKNGRGKICPHAGTATTADAQSAAVAKKPACLMKKIFTGISIISILCVLYILALIIFGNGTNMSSSNINSSSSSIAPDLSNSGVPMSADDFLSGQ